MMCYDCQYKFHHTIEKTCAKLKKNGLKMKQHLRS